MANEWKLLAKITWQIVQNFLNHATPARVTASSLVRTKLHFRDYTYTDRRLFIYKLGE
jgi:hypothetical protein